MLQMGLDGLFLEDLLLRDSNKTYTTKIALCNLTDRHEEYDYIMEFLSASELEYFNTLKFDKRIKSYLAGRLVAKKAIMALVNEEEPKEIQISNGIFNHPIVSCRKEENIQISITHCNDLAAAVAFKEHCPVGIDIEAINQKSVNSIEKILSDDEKKLIQHLPIDYDEAITLLWTAKEGVSKVLRTGLTLPMDFFEIQKIDIIEEGYTCNFRHFRQYSATSYNIGRHIMSIVYPKKVEITLDLSAISTIKL